MQEWYLLTPSTRPNATGGYENQSFTDFKNDAFQEALETDIATTVLLYNYDLSECKEIRCIVQGNTADTQLKSMERTILTSIGTLKAGMYLFRIIPTSRLAASPSYIWVMSFLDFSISSQISSSIKS